MKVVYIAGPFRGQDAYAIHCNVHKAGALTARVIGARDDAEFAVLCPHTMNAHFDGLACDDYFLRSTLEMMRRCDAVLMVPGWRASKGAMAERDEAIKLGIPVFEDLGDLIEWGEGTTA